MSCSETRECTRSGEAPAAADGRPLRALPGRVTVMGAARSGIAAARYLHDHGVRVFVSDACPAEKLEQMLADGGLAALEHEAGRHTERVLDCELIVLSPGIPSDLPLLAQARARGIAVWSEIELGYRCSDAEFLAVTGSSGKSTTTSMLGAIMHATGRPSVVAGNIGTPVINVAPSLPSGAVCVAEVSSFQLETCDAFRPRVAAVLNLLKNHLDRYPDEDAYYEAKKRIAMNLDSSCHLVLNARDERLCAWSGQMAARTHVAFFGARRNGHWSVWHENGKIVAERGHGRECLAEVSQMKVCGDHNYENAAAAAVAALAAGVEPRYVAEGLRSFEGLPHRLQRVGSWGGVTWYNDSKSTTAESVLVAIQAFAGNVHLIAGGRDKGCDFSVVRDALRAKVRQVVLIGEAAARMEKEWQGLTTVVRAGSLLEAIETAARAARSGDVVVLSPGCSSFDMFQDYEDRGWKFVKFVREHGPRLAGAQG